MSNKQGKTLASRSLSRRRRKRSRKNPLRILGSVFAAVFCVTLIALAVCLYHMSDARSDFQELSERVQKNELSPVPTAPEETRSPESTVEAVILASSESAAPTVPTKDPAYEQKSDLPDARSTDSAAPVQTMVAYSAETAVQTAVSTEPAPTEPVMLTKYAPLYEQNSDLFGWLRIEDTVIDYPVMYTPDDPEKYRRADFAGEYSYSGTPFLDSACTADSDNLLIYGHNMRDGSMFHSLINYQDEAYWQAHSTISFDTLYEEGEYEVLAAFYDRVYYQHEKCFKFYQFIDAADETDFDNAIANLRSKALYDTGVTAVYGDKLITLVTCTYQVEDGRFVVVARKK